MTTPESAEEFTAAIKDVCANRENPDYSQCHDYCWCEEMDEQ